jgi:DivIVA domain-containing protein
VFWVQLVVVLAVLGGIAWVAAGRGGGITPAYSDRPDLALPPSAPLGRSDVDSVRFTVGLRGYRMDEVDEVLDRLAFEIAERDAYIAELRGTSDEAEQPEQANGTAPTAITEASETTEASGTTEAAETPETTGAPEAVEAAEPVQQTQPGNATDAVDGAEAGSDADD